MKFIVLTPHLLKWDQRKNQPWKVRGRSTERKYLTGKSLTMCLDLLWITISKNYAKKSQKPVKRKNVNSQKLLNM